jgi:flagellar assembly protein FliH
MSAALPLEAVGRSHPGTFQIQQATDAEIEMAVAEARLIACQLLNDARQQAEAVIDDARKEAMQHLETARADARALREQARQDGYEDGRREGLLAVAGEREKFEAERSLQRKKMERERLKMIKELEPSLIQLAVQIARKIVHAELKLFPEQVSRIAESVLAQVREPGRIILKTSPADSKTAVSLPDGGEGGMRIERVVDDTLRHGDFIAKTSFGMIDGTIEGQLGVIEQRLMGVARNDRSS